MENRISVISIIIEDTAHTAATSWGAWGFPTENARFPSSAL